MVRTRLPFFGPLASEVTDRFRYGMVIERIGFIGIGIMGEPMAGHLAAAGWPICLHDPTGDGIGRIVAAYPGVTVAASPAEVGERSDIVITMLPDGVVVQAVATGPGGLIETMRPGALLLDTSSAQPG